MEYRGTLIYTCSLSRATALSTSCKEQLWQERGKFYGSMQILHSQLLHWLHPATMCRFLFEPHYGLPPSTHLPDKNPADLYSLEE